VFGGTHHLADEAGRLVDDGAQVRRRPDEARHLGFGGLERRLVVAP
jgi:hypothetical protein